MMREFQLDYVIEILPETLKFVKVTLFLAGVSFVIGLIIALAVALIMVFKVKGLYTFCNIYISFFRGTPLIAQLFFIHFGLPNMLPIGFRQSAEVSAIIGLSLNISAYMAESLRAAIISVDKGQMEAGLSIGLHRLTALKRIVLPQAIRIAIPPLFNSLIDIVKGSSLCFALGIKDMMAKAQLEASSSYKYFECYFLILILYWLLAIILGRIQRLLEIKMNKAY